MSIKLLSDDEFYEKLDHCIQCNVICQKDELRSYLGVCANCHHADIFEIYDIDDDYDDYNDNDDDNNNIAHGDDEVINIQAVAAGA